jgi:hypothetical protein
MTDARLVLPGKQCREARQLLGISKDTLAQAANAYPETSPGLTTGTRQPGGALRRPRVCRRGVH